MNTKLEYLMLMNHRENIYRFLGYIYRKEIDQALLDQIKEMSFPKDCGVHELDEGYRMLKEYLDNSSGDMINELAIDYAKVFLAAGLSDGSAAFPYESVYTSRKKIVMQDAWEQVYKVYAAEGLGKGDVGSDVLEDHIALELEFMAYLCKKAQNDEENQEWIIKQKEFINQHLLNWIPEFCLEIDKYADTLFYKGIGKITNGYLKMDKDLLDSINESYDYKIESASSYHVSSERMDELFLELKKEYKIYAPKCNNDLIRYGEINSVKEIVHNIQSDFSPKEVYYPVTQTMLYFKDSNCSEKTIEDTKGIIIFARPCDINAIKRLDNIFLKNGGSEDNYYKRLRDKVKIFMLECREGWDDCFCVSMGSNKTEDYSLAVRFEDDGLQIEVKDNEFNKYFTKESQVNFTPEFVQTNSKVARLPKIHNREELKTAGNLDFWKEYDDRCIGCGGCNTVCGTCSCFDTVDILYNETSQDGERRRVWSSCMLDTYTMTAGGNRSRKTPGANMRFKTLHKVYDYNLRFGGDEHMCVGCGRCDMRCPKDISFFDTINRLSDELEKYTLMEADK